MAESGDYTLTSGTLDPTIVHLANNKAVAVHVATREDASAVFPLAQSLATTFQLSQERFFKSFSSLLLDRTAFLLIVQSDGRTPAAYLLGSMHDTFIANRPVGWIEKVIVDPLFRRRDIATAMNEGFEVWAQDRGAGLTALGTDEHHLSTKLWATRSQPRTFENLSKNSQNFTATTEFCRRSYHLRREEFS